MSLFLTMSALTSAHELKVLSWNTFLMPSLLKKSFHDERLPHIKDVLKKSDYDIIMLQEVFTNKSYKLLNKELSRLGYHSTGKPFRSVYKPVNSGLVIFSKFPMKDVEIMLFDELAAEDKFSSKGVLFAKIKLPTGEIVQLATTHFQAKRDEKYQKIRSTHITQIENAFKTKIPSKMKVIFGGDFNITENQKEEYDNFKSNFSSLGLNSKRPSGRLLYTSDCIDNSLKKYLRPDCDSRKQVDYIFVRNINDGTKKSKLNTVTDLMVLDIEADYKTDDGIRKLSLSDHLSVEASISF